MVADTAGLETIILLFVFHMFRSMGFFYPPLFLFFRFVGNFYIYVHTTPFLEIRYAAALLDYHSG